MDSQTIERTAADWLAKRDGDGWTQGDEQAFLAWQRESTLHRVAVIRLKNVWQHADRLQALGAGVPTGSIPPPGQWRVSPFFLRRLKSSSSSPLPSGERARVRGSFQPRPWAFAAAVLLAVTAGVFWYSLAGGPDTYRTAIGDIKALRLTDGSQVTLNTNSKLHVAITASERRIELDRGEAFFEVAKDPTRPFVVRAGDKRVVAVGTRFSVLRTGNDLRVTVTEGKVRIDSTFSFPSPPSGGEGQGEGAPLLLEAGAIAHSGGAGVLVTHSPIQEVEQSLSWRSGYIMLRDTTLAEAIGEFNRYNERQLVLGDPMLADLRIGGNLRLTNVDAFVRVLEQGFPIEADPDGDRIVLRRK